MLKKINGAEKSHEKISRLEKTSYHRALITQSVYFIKRRLRNDSITKYNYLYREKIPVIKVLFIVAEKGITKNQRAEAEV